MKLSTNSIHFRYNKVFNFTNILFIVLLMQCSSVSMVREPLTERDKETIPNLKELQEKGIQVTNERAIIKAMPEIQELKGYYGIMNSLTMELVDNLGGVEVVEPRSLFQLLNEKKMINEIKASDAAINQELGIESMFSTEEELDKTAKLFNFYSITSRLTQANYSVKYNPPETYTDKKTGETKTTDPFWTVTVNAGVNFSVRAPGGEEIFNQLLVNTYSKSHSEEPKDNIIHLYLPKVINYCFEDVKPELQSLFPMKSYVIAMKGDKKYAMVLGGSQNKIRTGRKFEVVNSALFAEEKPTLIKVFQVSEKDSWGEISGNPEQVKIGTEVVLKPQPLTIFDKIWRFIESNLGL